jgi:hypothetical protein
MLVNKTFDTVVYHERFRVTARAAEPVTGAPQVQILVEDTNSGAAIEFGRADLTPLLRVIREVVKAVDDAAAGLPSDPVERAARRVPSSGKYHGLQRYHMMKAYVQELEELRERHIQRFDDWAENVRNPPPYKPPVPEGQWDLGQ